MAQVEATTERIIAADAETVFDALADYAGTRGKLLPEHFSEYEVREGGDGEGTLVHWKLQATSKRVRDCLLEVTEPTDGAARSCRAVVSPAMPDPMTTTSAYVVQPGVGAARRCGRFTRAT